MENGECKGSNCKVEAFREGESHILACRPDTVGCVRDPYFAQADLTEHHDQVLADATQQIKNILEQIPPDPQGRTPSIVITRKGLLLAWVDHGYVPGENAVPVEDENERERVLGIRS